MSNNRNEESHSSGRDTWQTSKTEGRNVLEEKGQGTELEAWDASPSVANYLTLWS